MKDERIQHNILAKMLFFQRLHKMRNRARAVLARVSLCVGESRRETESSGGGGGVEEEVSRSR